MIENKQKIKIFSSNRKAHLDFEFHYIVEAGLVLKGDEVRSFRTQTPSLFGVYAMPRKNELFLENFQANLAHNTNREKKLLLKRREINKINGLFSKHCYTILPLEFYEKNGLFKIKLAVSKNLNKIDKREKIKQKEEKHKLKYDPYE